MKEPTVLVLSGKPGVGKTRILELFRDANAGAIQIMTPSECKQPLDLLEADWDNHAGIALDEVLMWDRATVPAAIVALEQEALVRGKKLILVIQRREDLDRAEIHLTSDPAFLELEVYSQQLAVRFSFDGRSIQFPSQARQA